MKHAFSNAEFRAMIIKNNGGIDLTKNFFQLDSCEISQLERFKEIFNFNGKNNLGRSELRQFYYHIQKGYAKLEKGVI